MPESPISEDRNREEAEHDAGAEEEEGRGWYDLGPSPRHDNMVDARSWSSHGDRILHSRDSAARSGSVGSNDESPMDRASYRSASSSFHVTGYSAHHAAHMVYGETKFPTATSYVSDAQRSDVATVCSGSVAEDIEVESVISQEDHAALAASPSRPRSRPYLGANNRLVEFADLPASDEPPDKRHNRHERSSPDVSNLNAMGPPLRRALLLRGDSGISSSRAGSVKSYGSAGSEPAAENPESCDVCASSNQPYVGGDDDEDGPFENETDEAGSLDVEAHSVGTRSIHSQDDVAPFGDDEGGFDNRVPSLSMSEPVVEPETTGTLAQVERNVNGGRQSPGGTIYKGRGTRRYQGRYMHLPLKRFHHNGVHLEALDGDGRDSVHGRKRLHRQPYDSRRGDERPESYESRRPPRRFRSRSRSPDDEDRKPAASNRVRRRM